MADPLRWSVAPESRGAAPATRVTLSGDLTEDTDLSELLGTLSGKVVFDLAGIRRINSPGVREWLQFVESLGARGVVFELERCSPAVVHQLNVTSNFRGSGTVRSILAPFFCPSCEREHARLIELEGNPRAPAPPSGDDEPCPTCGAPMEATAQTLLLHLPTLNRT